MKRLSRDKSRGSIFVLSMWILLLLSIFSLSAGYAVRQKMKLVDRLENRQELRRIAESGIVKAVYVLRQDNNHMDGLTENWSSYPEAFKDIPIGEGFVSIRTQEHAQAQYGAVDEESKININLVKSPLVFQRLFHNGLGIDEGLSNQLAHAMIDWRDEDDNPYESGAESTYYQSLNPPYAAKNTDYTALEELLFVKGMTLEIYNLIKPYLTVDSIGKINLNTASKPVLLAMGFSDSLAEKLLAYRIGLDRIKLTEDDNLLNDANTIVTAIDAFASLTEEELSSLQDYIGSGLFTIQSSHFEIVAQAILPHRRTSLTVRCVVLRESSSIQILSWQESFHSSK